MIIKRSEWLRGDINTSYLCDDENRKDALGFYLSESGIDNNTLYNEVDPLELVYSEDIEAGSILPLLVQVDLKDAEYPGLHWNLRPEVHDIMLINDQDVDKAPEVPLSDGVWRLYSESAREVLLAEKFLKLGEIVQFVD